MELEERGIIIIEKNRNRIEWHFSRRRTFFFLRDRPYNLTNILWLGSSACRDKYFSFKDQSKGLELYTYNNMDTNL